MSEYNVETDPYLSDKTKSALLEATRLNGGQETSAHRFLRETAHLVAPTKQSQAAVWPWWIALGLAVSALWVAGYS